LSSFDPRTAFDCGNAGIASALRTALVGVLEVWGNLLIAIRFYPGSAIVAACGLCALSVGAASLVPPSADKLAKAAEHWQNAKDALGRFHREFPEAVTTTIQEEELRRAFDAAGQPASWGCEKTLNEVKANNITQKKEVNKALTDADTALKAAANTVRGLPAGTSLPWSPSDFKDLQEAIKSGKKMDGMVDTSKTSATAQSLQKLATAAMDYSRELSPSIGSVAAPSLVPRSVTVPCIGKVVTIPVK
jgi:hypothetical protein